MTQSNRFILLIILTTILAACNGKSVEKQTVLAPPQDPQPAIMNHYNPSVVVLWNEVMLAAVRSDSSKPTVTTRAMFMVHTAMYDAWSVYDDVAQPVELISGMRRMQSDRTASNKEAAVAQAAYQTLVNLYPEFEANTRSFETMLRIQGFEPDNEISEIFEPSDIGLMAARSVINARKFDGSNQENGYEDVVSDQYPNLYEPQNHPVLNGPGTPQFAEGKWQPLRVPTGSLIDEKGNPIINDELANSFEDQLFTTPHWGAVTPFALVSGDQFRPAPPPIPGSKEPYEDSRGTTGTNDEIYRLHVDEILKISANLTDEQKVIAEYWADGPRSETPPGHWNALAHGVSERDRHSIDEDVKFYFALNAALFDAGIATWDAKRHYDYIRPISAIQNEFAGEVIEAWGGPNEGTQMISGEKWKPYQQSDFVTPPFAEYVSGHSAFSAAAATVFTEFTGSEQYYDGQTVLYFSDFNSDGVPDLLGQHVVPIHGNLFEQSPSSVVVLTWATFEEAADEAGLSRLYGGIHFVEGDLNGRKLGREVGNSAFTLASNYWLGKK